MKNIVGILLMIFLLTSCKNSQKVKIEKKSDSENTITQSEFMKLELNQNELVIQSILDLPDLQWVYHPELKERLPIKILESGLIRKSFNLNKFGQKIRILLVSELEKEGIKDYLIFDKINIIKDTTDFELSYKVEGIGCSGKFVKENEEWKVLDYFVLEN
ncbi:MAG: hypothetical protein COA88_06430 [Kordia sp.]|nr:MAG: hypothetical protein COA88_06430 [Kordia sp.]